MNCQHHCVDNDSFSCTDCGEVMTERSVEAETIQTAPNLAAGTDMYIPDRARQRTVTIAYAVTYQCRRCRYNGSHVSEDGVIESCGQVHRGERMPA